MSERESPGRRSESDAPASRSLVDTVCRVQPYYVLLFGLLPGFALLFGSFVLGIATLTAFPPTFATTDREVGYLAAFNWSVVYAILFPLALYLMASTISGLADALDRLHARGMVLNKDLARVYTTDMTSAWLAGSRARSWLLTIFAVAIPAGFAGTEWFINNLLRLIHVLEGPFKPSDYDWGLAGLIAKPGEPEWSLAGRLANAAFDLGAFATEALLIGSLIAFFIVVLDLGRVVPSGRRTDVLHLLPDFNSKDPRRGFEEFEYALEQLLGVALVAYLICYLVRLEGAYMASASATSLAEFVREDILAGILAAASDPTSKKSLADEVVRLFNLGEQQPRGMLAWMLSILIAVFSLVTVLFTVRGAARAAKLNALRGLREGSLPSNDPNQASVPQAVESMVIWPFGYLKLDVLLLYVCVAVVTLALYRVGLFLAGIVVFALIFRMVKRLLRPDKTAVAKKQEV
jgi:hypothetical protein